MKLNSISDKAGARHVRKRVGRGIGSGLGKTAGRGGKGQTARSGGAKAGFEGGQMPIYRRLPKRGFTKPNALSFNEINLGRLQAAIDAGRLDAGKPVDATALLAAGLTGKPRDGVRLLRRPRSWECGWPAWGIAQRPAGRGRPTPVRAAPPSPRAAPRRRRRRDRAGCVYAQPASNGNDS